MQAEQSLTFGRYSIDLRNGLLRRGNHVLPLTGKAFAALRYLSEHAGQVVSKAELFAALWPNTVVSDGALTFCIVELRKVLGDNAKTPRFIETVHRRGYRFIAPLTAFPHSSPESRVQSLESEKYGEASPLQTQDARRQTLDPPLVGRDTDLQQLHQQLAKALNGERQVIFVTGEPGIGKTTLLETFLQSLASRVRRPESEDQKLRCSSAQTLDARPQTLDGRGWVAVGQCIEQHGAGEAFLPVLDAMSRWCRGPHSEQVVDV